MVGNQHQLFGILQEALEAYFFCDSWYALCYNCPNLGESLFPESPDRREASHALTNGGSARGFTQGLGRRDAMHCRMEGGDPMGSEISNPAASEVAVS